MQPQTFTGWLPPATVPTARSSRSDSWFATTSVWNAWPGWIGYLFAFASLGYNFILQPQLRPIWNQLQAPKEQLVDVERLVTSVAPPGPHCMLLVRSPEAFEGSLVVCIGDRMVLLPGSAALLDSPPPPEEGGINLSGVRLVLPRSPEHRMDFYQAA